MSNIRFSKTGALAAGAFMIPTLTAPAVASMPSAGLSLSSEPAPMYTANGVSGPLSEKNRLQLLIRDYAKSYQGLIRPDLALPPALDPSEPDISMFAAEWDFAEMDQELSRYCDGIGTNLDALTAGAAAHFVGQEVPEPSSIITEEELRLLTEADAVDFDR